MPYDSTLLAILSRKQQLRDMANANDLAVDATAKQVRMDMANVNAKRESEAERQGQAVGIGAISMPQFSEEPLRRVAELAAAETRRHMEIKQSAEQAKMDHEQRILDSRLQEQEHIANIAAESRGDVARTNQEAMLNRVNREILAGKYQIQRDKLGLGWENWKLKKAQLIQKENEDLRKQGGTTTTQDMMGMERETTPKPLPTEIQKRLNDNMVELDVLMSTPMGDRPRISGSRTTRGAGIAPPQVAPTPSPAASIAPPLPPPPVTQQQTPEDAAEAYARRRAGGQ
jgi:hypothetical protein